MKNYLIYTLTGIITAAIALLFTDMHTAVTIGFFTALALVSMVIVRVWYREIGRILRNDRYRTITIRKGFHRPFPWFVFRPFFVFRSHNIYLGRTVKFTEQSVYPNPDAMYSVNKLFGFSLGNPHKNSWRWGWYVTPQGKIMLCTYEYNNGVRKIDNYKEVSPGISYHLYILYVAHTKRIKFIADHKTYSTFVRLPRFTIGWMLGNYFGGRKSAPQKIQYKTL